MRDKDDLQYNLNILTKRAYKIYVATITIIFIFALKRQNMYELEIIIVFLSSYQKTFFFLLALNKLKMLMLQK